MKLREGKKPVEPVEKSPIHYLPPSADRGDLRSITPMGFAQAEFEANRFQDSLFGRAG
jgi:hypothetical protein